MSAANLKRKKEGKRKKGERKRGGGREERGKRRKKKEEKKRSFTLLSVAKHSLIPQVFPNIVLDQILKFFLWTLNQNMNLKVVCGISITCSPGVSSCVTFQCSRSKPASTPSCHANSRIGHRLHEHQSCTIFGELFDSHRICHGTFPSHRPRLNPRHCPLL